MRPSEWIVLVAVVLLLTTGCITTQQDQEKAAYRTGRLAVMVWTAESENFTPERRAAIVNVWQAFHTVINSDNLSDAVPYDLVKAELEKQGLSDAELDLAIQFMSFALEELDNEVDIPDEADQVIAVLKEFDRGVSSGLKLLK